MVSNPSVSLALRVSLTLSTPTLALSFTATALPAACAPFPDVFMDSSCVFSQLFPPNVTQDWCCSCGCPQGWEHGQVISRADQPWHLSSAAYGDWGFNSQAGSDPLSGNFQSHDLIWSIYWEYTGLCCWVSFMHLGNLGVIPRNGQCVCVLFCWRKISCSGPGARALGQGKRLRWCVSCCPQSLQLPTESLPCSATIPGQSTPLSLFFTNHEWSPTLVAEHLILARAFRLLACTWIMCGSIQRIC